MTTVGRAPGCWALWTRGPPRRASPANFSGPELTKVFAIFGPVLGLGGIIGPVLGGFLIEGDFFGLGRRSVFLINLPIGIAALVVAAKFVPKRAGDRTVRVDMAGAALVVVSCALLVLPLNQGQEDNWPLWTWLCMAASVIGSSCSPSNSAERPPRAVSRW